MKFLHRWLATNDRQKKAGRSTDDRCRLCREPETSFHIFYCQDCELLDKRRVLWQESQYKLRKHITESAVAALNIGSAQDRVEEGVQNSDYFINDPQVHRAYLPQHQIGWKQLYIGRFTKEWNCLLT